MEQSAALTLVVSVDSWINQTCARIHPHLYLVRIEPRLDWVCN